MEDAYIDGNSPRWSEFELSGGACSGLCNVYSTVMNRHRILGSRAETDTDTDRAGTVNGIVGYGGEASRIQ